MLLQLSLRFSWIFLLLFSVASCRPLVKDDYRYPYRWSSGPAPGSQPQADGPERPLELQPQQVGSGNQPPSSAASSQSYDANQFQLASGSSANPPRAPAGPVQHGGHVGGPMGAVPPGFFAPPQSGSGAGGASFVGPVPSLHGPAAGSWPAQFGPPSAAGLPWAGPPSGGDGFPGLVFPDQWLPSGDLGQAEQEAEPQSASETIPLPPSSYIIQSRSSYMRARALQSNSKYTPEYFEVPISPFQAAAAEGERARRGSGPGGGAGQAAASTGQKV